MPRKYCSRLTDVPKATHYAIISGKSHWVQDDGYGESDNIPYLEYLALDDEEDWKKEIADRTLKGDTNFMALYVMPPKITAKVSVDLDVKF